MRVVGFLDSCRIAACQLANGVVKYVAVAALMLAIGLATAQGRAPEDPPTHPVIEKTVASAPIAASGAIAQQFVPPPRVMVVLPHEEDALLLQPCQPFIFSGHRPSLLGSGPAQSCAR